MLWRLRKSLLLWRLLKPLSPLVPVGRAGEGRLLLLLVWVGVLLLRVAGEGRLLYLLLLHVGVVVGAPVGLCWLVIVLRRGLAKGGRLLHLL